MAYESRCVTDPWTDQASTNAGEDRTVPSGDETRVVSALHYTPTDIVDAERVLGAWRYSYNHERPHEALGMRCPADLYKPSDRIYCDTIKKYEYGGEYHVIKVNSLGYVRFDGWQVYLSESMIDEYIEFRPNDEKETFVACYRNFVIAEFDVHTEKLIHRKIARL